MVVFSQNDSIFCCHETAVSEDDRERVVEEAKIIEKSGAVVDYEIVSLYPENIGMYFGVHSQNHGPPKWCVVTTETLCSLDVVLA